mgnify:FL=1
MKKNRGFTLVEMIVVVSIFAILLGIMIPSLNSILGFRVQRATESIATALDQTKIEASGRLVGAMKLEKRSDGYYISYILDRGKVGDKDNIKTNENEEKIAPSKTSISYYIKNSSEEKYLTDENPSIVITYDRASGAFLPLMKTGGWEDFDVLAEVQNADSYLNSMQLDGNQYCSKIVVKGGSRTRTITLIPETGKYEITAGETP